MVVVWLSTPLAHGHVPFLDHPLSVRVSWFLHVTGCLKHWSVSLHRFQVHPIDWFQRPLKSTCSIAGYFEIPPINSMNIAVFLFHLLQDHFLKANYQRTLVNQSSYKVKAMFLLLDVRFHSSPVATSVRVSASPHFISLQWLVSSLTFIKQ